MGRSRPFVELLEEAGIVEQEALLNPLVIRKPEQVSIGDAALAALPGPSDHLEILYEFEAGAPLGRQIYRCTLNGKRSHGFRHADRAGADMGFRA